MASALSGSRERDANAGFYRKTFSSPARDGDCTPSDPNGRLPQLAHPRGGMTQCRGRGFYPDSGRFSFRISPAQRGVVRSSAPYQNHSSRELIGSRWSMAFSSQSASESNSWRTQW